jgi:predicted GIY-YIG superfamily endonuclease
MTSMLVYKATNTINRKFYIGITARQLKDRVKEHISDSKKRGGCPAFHAAIRKYGKDAFSWEILHKDLLREDAESKERLLIATLKPAYNIAPGGRTGGGELKGRPVVCINSGEVFPSGAEASRTLGLSIMRVSQICRHGGATREGLRFRFEDAEEVIVRSPDPEMIEAGRRSRVEKLKARRHPPATIERMKAAAKLRGISQVTREAADKVKLKQIRCVETGEIFPHADAAGKAFKLKRSSIYALICVPGKKSGAGYSFEHVSEAA